MLISIFRHFVLILLLCYSFQSFSATDGEGFLTTPVVGLRRTGVSDSVLPEDPLTKIEVEALGNLITSYPLSGEWYEKDAFQAKRDAVFHMPLYQNGFLDLQKSMDDSESYTQLGELSSVFVQVTAWFAHWGLIPEGVEDAYNAQLGTFSKMTALMVQAWRNSKGYEQCTEMHGKVPFVEGEASYEDLRNHVDVAQLIYIKTAFGGKFSGYLAFLAPLRESWIPECFYDRSFTPLIAPYASEGGILHLCCRGRRFGNMGVSYQGVEHVHKASTSELMVLLDKKGNILDDAGLFLSGLFLNGRRTMTSIRASFGSYSRPFEQMPSHFEIVDKRDIEDEAKRDGADLVLGRRGGNVNIEAVTLHNLAYSYYINVMPEVEEELKKAEQSLRIWRTMWRNPLDSGLGGDPSKTFNFRMPGAFIPIPQERDMPTLEDMVREEIAQTLAKTFDDEDSSRRNSLMQLLTVLDASECSEYATEMYVNDENYNRFPRRGKIIRAKRLTGAKEVKRTEKKLSQVPVTTVSSVPLVEDDASAAAGVGVGGAVAIDPAKYEEKIREKIKEQNAAASARRKAHRERKAFERAREAAPVEEDETKAEPVAEGEDHHSASAISSISSHSEGKRRLKWRNLTRAIADILTQANISHELNTTTGSSHFVLTARREGAEDIKVTVPFIHGKHDATVPLSRLREVITQIIQHFGLNIADLTRE